MTTAVLVMAYGTPARPEDVLSFYTDVRRGRPPTTEQLMDLERRYDAIGGVSPMNERTLAQVQALQHALDVQIPNAFTVVYGSKHAPPYIEDAIATIADQGHRDVIGLVLAPHYSRLSVGEYIERAKLAADAHGLRVRFIERWGNEPELITSLGERVREALLSIEAVSSSIEVVFSAHSLPTRILDSDDPYRDEIAETARLVAAEVGLSHFRTGWQSAGRTTDDWLGPDLCQLFEQLRDEGFDGVVICPAGFTADHLEILYDLDIEARQRAQSLGLAFVRTRSLNDDPKMASLLARRVLAEQSMLDLPGA